MKRREAVVAIIAGTMLVLGLLAVFAIELSNTQAKSKGDVEARVHERSVLAAALIDSLFQTSSHTSAVTDARLYGGLKVPGALLNKARANNRYAVLLDSSDHVIAASAGFTAQSRSDLAFSETLRLLHAGRPWALGNVLPYGKRGIVNFGIVVSTRHGRRYLLQGIDPQVLGPFLLGELRQIPGVRGAFNSILDGNGVIISSTNPAHPAGYRFHTPTQLSVLHQSNGDVKGRYFDQVPLEGTSWHILLSAPNGPLFASVTGLRKWLPWAIFGAFALIGLLAMWLAVRGLRSSGEVEDALKQLEVAHRQLAESNQALAVTNSELEVRARELARSNAELDQFASIASHDLQEPLRKVRTFTERITETEGDALSERGRDYLKRANASAERMQRLVEDLLKFSRVATQGRPFTTVNLSQVTAEVLEDLDDSVARSGAVISVGQLPSISADAPQMRQLMQNLISNAVKFRREGVTPEIKISSTTEEGWVKLVVQDNGIGFDPQYARRIFRVFERLHGRNAYPGTGIGLALCRKIAERHGGTVFAESVPGEGSTFTVAMQSQRTEAVADAPPSPPAGTHATSEEPYAAV